MLFQSINISQSKILVMLAFRVIFVVHWAALRCHADLQKPQESEQNVSRGLGHLEKNVADRKLIVTTQLQPPYMLLRQHGNFLAGNERFEGFLADILHRLATSIGFEYEIRLSRDFGRLPDGMIHEVQKGGADIAAGAIIMPRTAFHPDVDFTEPFLSFRVSALIRRPQGSRSVTESYTIANNVFQVLGSNLTYGVIQYGPVHQLMNNSTDPIVRALWTRITNFWPPGLVSSVQEGIDRARREHYAFLVETPTAEYVASRRPCDLYASEPFLDVMSYAFVMRRDGFRLRGLVSRELRRMKQTGELQTLYLKWWRDECAGHFVSARRSSEVESRRRLATASAATSRSHRAIVTCDLFCRFMGCPSHATLTGILMFYIRR